MEDVRKDFKAFHESRTRSVEEARTVDEPHPPHPCGGQVRPPGGLGDRGRFLPSPIEVKPARHEHDHIGLGAHDFVRRDASGFLSRMAHGIDPSSQRDHFGNPVTTNE